VQLIFETPDGQTREVEGRVGLSLMEVAINALVDGIDGECGGGCSCATCHVFIDPAWADKVPPVEEYERDLIESLDNAEPTSRLSCQIRLSKELDGMKVKVPEIQGF